jgi:glutathione S-transferase
LVQATKPTLYSFVRCPYAIRARFALALCEQEYEHREVDLKSKPKELLRASPKGTVPVLILPNGRIIDESEDIMIWAFLQKTPEGFMPWDVAQKASGLDAQLFQSLNIAKFTDRHDSQKVEAAREYCLQQLSDWDNILSEQPYFLGKKPSWVDAASVPFVRQAKKIFSAEMDQGYCALNAWLSIWLEHRLFSSIMKKYDVWENPN